MNPALQHVVVAAAIFVAVSLFARLLDWWLQRRPLAPEAVTRYRIFRRTVTVAILVVGFFSALLAIPEVRAVAGGLLASSALLGIVIGFAAQRTLGNFVAGVLIAVAQPVRIGDRVEYQGTAGVVEAIVNASIRSRETLAEVSVPVPLSADLDAVLVALREDLADQRDGDVYVGALDGGASVTLRAVAGDEAAAERLERELRLRAHRRLRTLGVWD